MEASLVKSVGEKESKAFDDPKLGVNGLVDSGAVNNTPGRIFTRPREELLKDYPLTSLQVPVIDLEGLENSERRKHIIEQVRDASEQWGFFQVVNHGCPLSVLQGMIEAMRLFHEKDVETKKQLYANYDPLKKVRVYSSVDLYQSSQTADPRDTLVLTIQPSNPIEADDLPESCRWATMEYLKHADEVGDTICELLSEALGLKAEHLKAMECTKGYNSVTGSYYPACPEPNGISKHTDVSFFTILLQDHIGGLQVLHEDMWAEVEPIVGALVINIGDLLQMATNDKFKSAVHRVVVNKMESRVSVACFFHGSSDESVVYGPIQDLVSEENPAIYRGVKVSDFMEKFFTKRLHGDELRNLYKL